MKRKIFTLVLSAFLVLASFNSVLAKEDVAVIVGGEKVECDVASVMPVPFLKQ